MASVPVLLALCSSRRRSVPISPALADARAPRPPAEDGPVVSVEMLDRLSTLRWRTIGSIG